MPDAIADQTEAEWIIRLVELTRECPHCWPTAQPLLVELLTLEIERTAANEQHIRRLLD